MRAWPVLGVLLAGLCFCGTAGAQNAPDLYQRSYSGPVKVPVRQPSTSLATSVLGGGRFKARLLFQRVFGIDNRPSYTTATIPDPNSPEYLKAFGFQRVGR